MFPRRFFPNPFFAPRYWPKVGAGVVFLAGDFERFIVPRGGNLLEVPAGGVQFRIPDGGRSFDVPAGGVKFMIPAGGKEFRPEPE